jgi:hypothetical protein
VQLLSLRAWESGRYPRPLLNWAATEPPQERLGVRACAVKSTAMVVLPKLRLDFQVTASTVVRAAACHVDLINGPDGQFGALTVSWWWWEVKGKKLRAVIRVLPGESREETLALLMVRVEMEACWQQGSMPCIFRKEIIGA